jgi:hypothetical protein
MAGATMPSPEDLPSGLSEISRRQAMELTPGHFEADADRLFDIVEATLRGDSASMDLPPTDTPLEEAQNAHATDATSPQPKRLDGDTGNPKLPRARPTSRTLAAFGAAAMAVAATLVWFIWIREGADRSYDLLVDKPGAVASASFDASEGERVSVQVRDNTVDGYVYLIDPEGNRAADVYIQTGRTAFLDAVALTRSGSYTLRLDGEGERTGRATLLIKRS